MSAVEEKWEFKGMVVVFAIDGVKNFHIIVLESTITRIFIFIIF